MTILLTSFATANTLAGVYSYSFAIPYFPILLVLLLFGIAYMSSEKVQLALVIGFLASIMITSLAPSMLNIGVSGIFGFLVAISIIETTLKNKRGVKSEAD